jgi:CPA1 family monovalent cation:H+ antiporter
MVQQQTVVPSSDTEDELLQLKIETQKYAAKRLHAKIAEDETPTEEASALWLMYQRSINALVNAQKSPSFSTIAKTQNKTLELQRLAYELELDAIRSMRDDDRISPRYAKTLHSNVMLMMLDLEGTV